MASNNFDIRNSNINLNEFFATTQETRESAVYKNVFKQVQEFLITAKTYKPLTAEATDQEKLLDQAMQKRIHELTVVYLKSYSEQLAKDPDYRIVFR